MISRAMRLTISTLNKLIVFWCVVICTTGLYLFIYEFYEPKIVYACHEVDKNDPPDVQRICERLTKRKTLK